MKIKDIACLAIELFGLSLLFPAYASAYIDPGIGSMLLQGLAAGAIAVLVVWRRFRHKIASLFKKQQDPTDNNRQG